MDNIHKLLVYQPGRQSRKRPRTAADVPCYPECAERRKTHFKRDMCIQEASENELLTKMCMHGHLSPLHTKIFFLRAIYFLSEKQSLIQRYACVLQTSADLEASEKWPRHCFGWRSHLSDFVSIAESVCRFLIFTSPYSMILSYKFRLRKEREDLLLWPKIKLLIGDFFMEEVLDDFHSK